MRAAPCPGLNNPGGVRVAPSWFGVREGAELPPSEGYGKVGGGSHPFAPGEERGGGIVRPERKLPREPAPPPILPRLGLSQAAPPHTSW